MRPYCLLVVLLVGCFLVGVTAEDHHYLLHEEVPLFVNKIGPYSNPSETYSYYHLPFCRPPEVQHKHASLGEVLEGDRMQSSLYDLRFQVNIEMHTLCKLHLNTEDVETLKNAIDQYYYFEMVYDDLPVYGFLGVPEVDSSGSTRHFLFTHLHFNILYNEDQIVGVNATMDESSVVEIGTSEQTVTFTYSAKWYKSNISFEDRMKRYSEHSFFQKELEIHWLSIFNSFILVIMLSGFLAIIVCRILRNDYSRYSKDRDGNESGSDDEEYGWKLVYGDVFRYPPYPSLFAASLGTGMQFVCMAVCILVLAIIGVFYPENRGAMQTSAVVLYALTAVIAGYTSASMYKKLEGKNWVWNVILTSCLYAVPFFLCWAVLNSIAIYYSSTSALPFGTIIIIFLIWGLIGFPLTVVGGIAGRNSTEAFQFPCRPKAVPREIPDIPFHRQAPAQMVLAGFLPFSGIYIELYYIFASVWGHVPYTLYGILMLVFVILIVVTACITVSLTYFQLATEDHRWWWRSFFSGGSTAWFVYGYAIFYYIYRSDMSGTLQGGFYFGYMLMACYAFFLMLGTVGFFASLLFVRHIYRNLKFD